MITEHTHSENNDWQGPGGEQPSVSENPTPQPVLDAHAREGEQTTEATTSSDGLLSTVEETGTTPADGEQQVVDQEVRAEDVQVASVSTEQETPAESVVSFAAVEVVTEEVVALSDEVGPSNTFEGEAPLLFPLEMVAPLAPEEGIRPFTDFIEEFRQREEHFSSLLNTTTESSFTTFVAGGESSQESATLLETTAEDLTPLVDVALPFNAGESVAPLEDQATLSASEEVQPGLTQPRLVPERPVSPLLRPATRPRVPRHGRHRIDELIHPAELRGDLPKASTPAPLVEESVSVPEPPAPEEVKPEEPPARPARRYRFDRPATSATPAAAKAPASTPAVTGTTRGVESREQRAFATHAETVSSAEPTAARASSSAVVETPVVKASVPEIAPAPVETPVPAPTPAPVIVPPTERRRRGNHERVREKEQPVVTPVIAAFPEPVAPIIEPLAPVVAEEIAVEDLPPLEYAELQAANSRRRRRRRAGTASTVAATPSANGVSAAKAVLPDLVVPSAPLPAPAPQPVSMPAPLPAPMPSKNVPTLPPAYNIVSGYTVSQMNQGNDVSGPFMGPEPSPARGSTFSSTTPRHVRSDAVRATPTTHPVRHTTESQAVSNASVNHMANVVSQAIQTQTDRMVAELRRANQVPTNISVSLPPFPSTERVGVFVDVANLLYSARTLRITVDFGKLLDFLRGNRRLVRAQAYCPTSPQPGDDQMFLQAVKGLGYRITTKNYKTFSSGAKKADLDLDLCMDVVRLVDGKAVDCIVLVSGDSDFMPMLDYCSDHGVRVEVAAFDESMSATLRQSCDLFVNLSMLEEIRS